MVGLCDCRNIIIPIPDYFLISNIFPSEGQPKLNCLDELKFMEEEDFSPASKYFNRPIQYMKSSGLWCGLRVHYVLIGSSDPQVQDISHMPLAKALSV